MRAENTPLQPGELSDDEKRALLVKLIKHSKTLPEMSVTQERIWQLAQISPGNPVYNFQSAISLLGPLNLAALTAAANQIVARHEPLRTAYSIAKGRPKLTLGQNLAVTIDTIDLSATRDTEQQERFQALATQAAQTGFAIDQPLLFRLQCYTLAANHHILVLTMHHLISDLLSLDLFFSELAGNYDAIVAGRRIAPTPPTWTYTDHARAERAGRTALLNGPAGQFWRKHLKGAPDLSWRSDFPRPRTPTGQAGTIHFNLDAGIVQAVADLSRREAVTPFVFLLSIYYILQWALSGSNDQLVAVPVAGRDRAENQGLIGMFSSPLPMRTQLSGHESLPTLLAKVRQTVLATFEHRAVPFADLIKIGQDGANGAPLVLRSMFSFVSRIKKLSFADLRLERILTNRGVSDFDLFLTIGGDGGSWHGIFEYNSDLFTAATAEDLADAYTTMISAATAQPGLTVAELAAPVPLPPALKIAVAATFTADLLAEAGQFWQTELRWPIEIDFAPYNQVFQALLDPKSLLHQSGNTLNVVLIRPEDWCRHGGQPLADPDALARTTTEFVAALRQTSLAAPLLVYLCPASPDQADIAAIRSAEQFLRDALTQSGITLVQAEQALAAYSVQTIFDAQADAIGHIPFSRDWYIALGTELIRRATNLTRPPSKVIALDCDNTLWRGVCAEEGAAGVQIDGPFRNLQQFVAQQAKQGMLLCLISKNEQSDVFAVFDHNQAMVLRREDIIAHRINWQPKSANLHELAAELHLGLDSFIFIDDNPLECAEVQAACPEVLTLCLPGEESAIPAFLRTTWAFDHYHTSAEDRLRHNSMIQNRQRAAIRRQTESFADFIANLQLEVDIAPADENSLSRLAQLSQRTNQFNNGGLRYSESRLRQLLTMDFHVLKVTVTDRFGSYGIVGALVYRPVGSALGVENFLLSCRVLGRGVEHRMLAELGRIAMAAGLAEVAISRQDTPRNQPFRQFFAGLDGGSHQADGTSYTLPAAQARQTRFTPGYFEQGPVPLAQADTPPPSAVHSVRQAAMAAVAGRFSSVDDITAQLNRQARRRQGGSGGPPPQGEVELAIAAIWQRVLHTDGFSRNDNFFEVGGNSLLLVQVNSELIQHFENDISIITLFQFPTIASLAKHFRADGATAENRSQAVNRGEMSRKGLRQRMIRLDSTR